jgi:hypothetical protein
VSVVSFYNFNLLLGVNVHSRVGWGHSLLIYRAHEEWRVLSIRGSISPMGPIKL